MKELVLTATGGPENFELREAEARAPAANEIRVKNAAIGVNFIDIYQRKGLYPVFLPATLGQEGAGTVIEAGAQTSFRPGDRVAYLSGGGAYAEEIVLDAARAARIPHGLSDDAAAASFLKGLTAEMLLRQVYPLKEGEVALVTAAAGGVGLLLCQWAVHLKARVIAVVGDASKESAVRALGCRDVIDRSRTPDVAGAVRMLTNGRGADVAYDSVGKATFEASLDSLGLRGMMVSYGNASGPVPPVAPLDLTRRGSLTLARPSLFHYATPDRLAGMAAAVFDLLTAGTLKPTIAATFPLAQGPDAHRLLEAGKTIGSIILKPQDPSCGR
ncbi:MAG: quinone oxidoreductase family protein [Parvularculaceae bacterium]